MNFYDVLAAEKWGGGIPTTNFFDLLFAQSISGEQWQVYEGTLPATINANGDNIKQYQVWGNIGGVGEPTENLFDKNAKEVSKGYVADVMITSDGAITGNNNFCISEYIALSPANSYKWKWINAISQGTAASLTIYDTDKNAIATLAYQSNAIVTIPSGAYYCRLSIHKKYAGISMLTEGTTPPASYVPFGYEVGISTSDGTSTTTTPIYIGNDPLEKVGNYSDYVDYELQKVVRVIKKYVLTGNENWEEITGAYASRKYFRWIFAPINYCIRHVCVSSHFTQVAITTSTTTVGFDVFDSTSVNGEVLAIRPSGVQSTTLEDFKAWLAEQYAAGTPVTVWCTLTVAEEADPPVPLPALPTCDGTTVIDYAGESVAPEKVYFEYQGGKQP